MPVIQAYRFGKNIIPIDVASIEDVYRCPWTRKIFTSRQNYIAHLASYRENTIHEKIRIANWIQVRDEFNSQPDFDSVVRWIESNSRWFLHNSLREDNKWRTNKHIEIPRDFKIKVTSFKLEYHDEISNSHSCPRDGVKNWHRNTSIPLGYPGWRGRIVYRTSHNDYELGRMFSNTGINTGCGGGNSDGCSYDVSIFGSDWPVIYSSLKLERCEALLKNDHFVRKWAYEY